MWLCFDLYTAGPIKMYSKTGQAVQVSNLSGEVVLSDDVGGATTFQLVGCRAWDTIPDEQRPHCFSMMYVNQADSYVRHHDSFLRVDPANETYDLPQFDLDSSFILLSDTFYPGLYGLKSINSPYYYITSHDDGRLGIIQRGHISNYYTTRPVSEFMVITRPVNARSCVYFSFWIHLFLHSVESVSKCFVT